MKKPMHGGIVCGDMHLVAIADRVSIFVPGEGPNLYVVDKIVYWTSNIQGSKSASSLRETTCSGLLLRLWSLQPNPHNLEPSFEGSDEVGCGVVEFSLKYRSVLTAKTTAANTLQRTTQGVYMRFLYTPNTNHISS
jgi:hypothetical protein